MQKQIITAVVISVMVSGVGGFLAGKSYATKASPFAREASFAQFGGGQFGQGGGGGGQRMMPRNGSSGAMISGEIIAKDDLSLTVKLRDGGSKIIFLPEKTEVMKTASGTIADVTVGATVMVSGTPNQDGSVTAQTLSIRSFVPGLMP